MVDVSSLGSSVRVGQSGLDPPPSLGIELSDAPDGAVIVRVLGDLDLCSAAELRAVLDRLAATARLTILDLSATSFIDCSGLGVVLQAALRSGSGSFTVARERSAPVARLIDLVGVDAALSSDGAPERRS
jgi:anti-anti-sigma factor